MSTSPLTVVQLQCFVQVVDSGSFARAGRQLGLSTSTVSKTILRIEQARGVRLLNRSTHSLSLTPEGEELIGLAREAVRSVGHVEAAFDAAARQSTGGRVRVSAPTSFLRTFLAPLIPAFRAAHPDILLDLRGSDHMVDLAEDGMDIVLRSGPVDGIPGHLRQILFSFSWVTVASPGYLDGRDLPLSPADLLHHDLIGFRNQRTGTVDTWRFRNPHQGGSEFRWMPNVAVMLDDGNAVARSAVAGTGIAFTPSWLVLDALSVGELYHLLADWTVRKKTVSIIRRKHANNPERVQRVISFLTDKISCGDLPEA